MLISHNPKGLNIPKKRTSLLRELSKAKSKIVFLQETHFKKDKTQKLLNYYFTKAIYAFNPLAKTKGVAILLSKNSNFSVTDQLADTDGRYLFFKRHPE